MSTHVHSRRLLTIIYERKAMAITHFKINKLIQIIEQINIFLFKIL